MHEKPKILAIAGPTASGKSALAVTLARELDGEVVSCDSMQIYRGMDIGTAKPTEAERGGVPHHLLDIVEPETEFSVMDYVAAAETAIADILSRGKLPILCGGTGLYLDAVLRGGILESPGADPAVRTALSARAAREGNEALHRELAAVDPESAAAIHPNNVRRVIRALEIYMATGIPKSEWDRRSNLAPARYRAAVLGLTFSNRELLYARIERRVDEMLEMGLEEETRRLLSRGVFAVSRTANAAIGYKELLPFLQGACTREAAIEELKIATRRYAKRQITWFSAKPYVLPLAVDEGESVRKYEEIVKKARELCESAWNML